MSRTQSQGLEYFPLAVDFFLDKKIKILKARYGADGITIYLYLLCMIYREGYYTKADNDLIYVISDDLNMSSDKVQQVLAFLFERSMFDEQLFKSDAVLTGTGIQERWQKAVANRAAKSSIEVGRFWLLKESETKPYIKCTLFNNSSEKKADNSVNYADNSVNYAYKVKESKVNNNTHTAHTREGELSQSEEEDLKELPSLNSKEFQEQFNTFTRRWGIVVDSCSPLLRDFDFDKLNQAYERSGKFLQCYPTYKCLSWIVKNYASIIVGKYDDHEKPEREGSRERQKPKYTSSYDPDAIPWPEGAIHVIRGGDDECEET